MFNQGITGPGRETDWPLMAGPDARTAASADPNAGSDADNGKISLGAPIARAMLGKRVGDEVLVKLPKGDREYEVVRVEYKAI